MVSKSVFTNLDVISQDPHSNASLNEFKKNNPEWNDIMSWYLQAENSVTHVPFSWENIANSQSDFKDCLNTTIIFGNNT